MSSLTNVEPRINDRFLDGFPVRVYRRTEHHGWQVMRPKNSQGRIIKMKATPKRGCVVLHRIQVRIRLSKSLSTNDSSSQSNNEDTKHQSNVRSDGIDIHANSRDGDTSDVLVIRRRHHILIASKIRSRSLVFKFKDFKSCLKFSDQLVQLNPHQAIQTTTSSNVNQNNLTLVDRGICSLHGLHISANENDINQVLSYVARLLCDERFENFCTALESSLLASEDGKEMFNALVAQKIHTISKQQTDDLVTIL